MNKLPKIGETQGGSWTRVNFLRVDVSEGFIIPFWFGLAYYDPMSRRGVCYPLVLNWVVWISREVYYKIRNTPIKGYGTWYDGYQKALKDFGVDSHYYRETLRQADEVAKKWKKLDE